jgi:hypothetical protein
MDSQRSMSRRDAQNQHCRVILYCVYLRTRSTVSDAAHPHPSLTTRTNCYVSLFLIITRGGLLLLPPPPPPGGGGGGGGVVRGRSRVVCCVCHRRR